jgi:hypothetical protein
MGRIMKRNIKKHNDTESARQSKNRPKYMGEIKEITKV